MDDAIGLTLTDRTRGGHFGVMTNMAAASDWFTGCPLCCIDCIGDPTTLDIDADGICDGVSACLTASPNTGRSFDGAGDRVVVPHSDVLNVSDLTLEAWVKIAASTPATAASPRRMRGSEGDAKAIAWTSAAR